MSIVLYGNKCPRCNVLESKLKQANIDFEENNDIEVMMQKGFKSAPVLEVDGIVYNFKEAVEWIKRR